MRRAVRISGPPFLVVLRVFRCERFDGSPNNTNYFAALLIVTNPLGPWGF